MTRVPDSADDRKARSFSSQFERQQGTPFPWKAVAGRSIVITTTGVVLYLVAPTLIAQFHAWPRLASVNRIWFVIVLVAEVAHFGCTFALQRIALRTRAWFPVVTAQLSGNAISRIIPGGAAAGAAVQFRMLAASGMDTVDAVGGLTAFSLLGIAGLLVLPVLVLPAVLFGAPISSGLYTAAVLGAVAFALFAGFGALVAATDTPIRSVGRVVQGARNRLFRKRAPMSGLSKRLLEQRDLILSVLGKQWWQATMLSAGRLTLDFLCLYAAVRAVGSRPRMSQVLLVYA
ncbi:MAG: lysylphosphatidylglycerol synthase domain-containing protein, partial [Acidimicrobiales bacterium]